MKLFISKKPEKVGGGSNTFAWNFTVQAEREGHRIVSSIKKAERAIIIAHFSETEELQAAKARGCYIVHRIDEYFERDESPARKQKHKKILALNAYADITVFQSQFVHDNAFPFIQPKRYEIILNGGDPKVFYPASEPGEFIGHVSWSVAERKRLDILYEIIKSHPEEQFLLVGRHKESDSDFRLPNVMLRGVRERDYIASEYRQMKLLLFPSENEPCPNIPIEAIMSGVPVYYNPTGGTPEVVRDCGEPLEVFEFLLGNLDEYRKRCLQREDLHFEKVFREYMAV